MSNPLSRFVRVCLLSALALTACGAPSPSPTPVPITPQVTLQPSTPVPVATPTPRPPGSPLVIDRLPARGEELQPDQPIEIVFDQPMDRRSVEQALQVRASDASLVEGSLTWKSDSVVVFTPAQPWLQAERYTIALGEAAKSAKGFALARPEQFEVNTVGRLAVAQTLPQDGALEVTADAAITVLFNRPVVSLTALAEQGNLPQPLVLEPPVEGKGEWLNTSIYLFRPAQPLQAGTTYRARVPAGLQDTTGAVLDADYGWTFSVAPPAVRFILPPPGSPAVDVRQPISVVFTQRMDRASAQAAFSIQPPVRGSFRWAEETPDLATSMDGPVASPSASRGEVMAFVPEEDYERGRSYVVTVRAGARAAVGSGATTQPAVVGFTAVPLPEVLGTSPENGETRADPNTNFVIRFNAPMSVPTIVPNLTFEPPVSLTQVYSFYDSFSNQFFLGVQFKPSTAYRVRIGADITDKYGVRLGKETEVRFTTAPLPPFVALENEGFVGVYNASRPTRLFVSHRNVTQIDLELVRLSLEEFYRFTGAPNSFELLQNYKPTPEAVVRRWSERVMPELNQLKRLRLDLAEGGGSLPTGIYLLNASAPELKEPDQFLRAVRHILIVSDLHLTLKNGDTTGLVWVTDLNTAQPLGGVSVSFRDHTFAEIASAQTSVEANTLGQALVTFPESYKSYQTLYAIVGQPGERFGVAWNEMSRGIAIYDFGLPGRYFAEPYLVYLFTDRPIYRPGQRVFFKGYVRKDSDARYTLPDVPAVQIAIETFNGFRVLSQTARLDDNGGFEGELALDSGATPGTYFIQVCVPLQAKSPNESPCAYGSTSFAVAAYRAPEFEVAVNTDKPDYAAGETMAITVEARYFFGGAVANANVRWSLTAEDYLFDRYRGPGQYDFSDYDLFLEGSRILPPFGFSELVANGEGVTDNQGRFTLRLPADLSKRRTSARFTLEATVTDVNDQSASARQSAIAHKALLYFGVSTDAYVYEVGSPIAVNVIAVDWQGKPMAGQVGEVVFSQREWMTVQEEDPQGRVFYTSVPSDTVVSRATVTTDAEGRASTTFTPQTGGEHRIKVANAARSVFVADPARYVGWRMENNDRIELRADRDTYEVGEVARVLVPSPFQGAVSALLTVERGGFLQRRTLTLNSNSAVLEIPIEESFAPNAFVSVLLVKGVDATNPVPAFRLGYARFRVSPKLLTLNVQITPDKATYAPRDTATYEIRVTDAAGAPAQVDLSLALVDKAVLNLIEPNVRPVAEAFYGERGLGVRTADTLSVNVDRVTERMMAAQAAKGGGGGGDVANVEFTRQLFKDTAFWSATLRTDANGTARVQVPLPDNLTTWVMTARAVGRDSRVGEATNEVVATKPLLVRPVTPRFFVAGDVVTLGAVVNNNTAEAINAQVAIASTNLVLIEGQPIQRVSVPAGGTARVNWRMSVQDADRSEITMTVSGGGLFDSTQPGLQTAEGGGIPILRYAAPEVIATAGDMAQLGRRVELIAIPPRLNTGRGDLTVRVDTSLAAAALRSAKAVEEYEYESNDWAATRLIVALALARARNQPPDNGAVSSALQRFYSTQLPNGGWGWWPNDSADPSVTAHVLFALAQAQQAGIPVNPDALNRGVDALRAQLVPATDLPSAERANQQAYFLFVLGELGQSSAAQANALYEQRAKLGHYGKALLALTLNRLQPGDARIATLLTDVVSAAALSATGASWREAEQTPWFNQSSDTRSTAIILYALAKLDAQNAIIPNVVRWLLAARTSDRWASLQETEWAILGLAAWLQASGEGSGSFAWRVALNDRAILNGLAATPDDAQTARVAVAELFGDRVNELAFERAAGQGRLYYTAHLRLFVPAESAPAVNRGIAIARKYERADCTPTLEQPCAAITSAKVGEEVRVRLTIVAPRDLYFVRVIDRLPAGAEAIDTTLKTTANLRPDQPAFNTYSPEGWGWWWFGHQQVYDDRVAVFASFLPAGTYEYTYLFRPSLAGEFQTMPASAELEYFPEVFGRSAGARFVIAPR